MNTGKYEGVKEEFQEALARLDDALAQEENEFMRDSAIKRFEMTFDLSWKTVKAKLETMGVRCASPLGCYREAYKQGIIREYEKDLPELVRMRNRTVHVYDEALAAEVYAKLPEASKLLHVLSDGLE